MCVPALHVHACAHVCEREREREMKGKERKGKERKERKKEKKEKKKKEKKRKGTKKNLGTDCGS